MESLAIPSVEAVIDGVKRTAYGEPSTRIQISLIEMGICTTDGRLTRVGKLLEEAYFVTGDTAKVAEQLTGAYRRLASVQAIVQSLRGRGNVPLVGLLHLMVVHNFLGRDDLPSLRAAVDFLGKLGIVSYNRRNQTLRVELGVEDESTDAPVIRVIDPDKPYSNLLNLRKIFRESQDYLYWADPHLERKALELLIDEVDVANIQDVRLLSGPAHINEKTRKDYSRFKVEMERRGVSVSWRVQVKDRDWHDRFIISAKNVWNVPPLNSLLKGDYSEAWNTSTLPPFDSWWDRSVELEVYQAQPIE